MKKSRPRKTHEEFCKELVGRNISPLNRYVLAKEKMKFKCDLDGHIWEATPNNILKGQGCYVCGVTKIGNMKRKSPDVFYNEISSMPLVAIDDYINGSTKIRFKCLKCETVWASKPENILSGKGCPSCAKYGFDISKPASLYVYLIDECHLGYGITNNMMSRRSRHNSTFKKYGVEALLLHEFKFSRGSLAMKLENIIKNTMPQSNCYLDGFKTETTHRSNYLDLMRIINGGVE